MPEDLPQQQQQTPSNNQDFGDLDEEHKQEWLRQKALDEILQTEQLYLLLISFIQQQDLWTSNSTLYDSSLICARFNYTSTSISWESKRDLISKLQKRVRYFPISFLLVPLFLFIWISLFSLIFSCCNCSISAKYLPFATFNILILFYQEYFTVWRLW